MRCRRGQKQLRKELLTLSPPLLYPPKSASNVAIPDPKSVDQLILLDAILQETLRLWGAVPGGQPRVTPSPSCTPAGYLNILPGARVQAQAFTITRTQMSFSTRRAGNQSAGSMKARRNSPR